MRIYRSTPKRVSEATYRSLRRLTLGWRGEMLNGLDRCRLEGSGTLYYAKDGPTVAGWALILPVGVMGEAHVYVRSTHRRRGLGRRLMGLVLADHPRAITIPWDRRSKAFYRAVRR